MSAIQKLVQCLITNLQRLMSLFKTLSLPKTLIALQAIRILGLLL